MSLTTTVTSSINWTQYDPIFTRAFGNINTENNTFIYNSGTGINFQSINALWYAELTGVHNLALSGLSQSYFEGNSLINFSNGYIKTIVVNNPSGNNSGILTLPFNTCNGNIMMYPSGRILLNDSSGWLVNSTDILTISGNAPIPYAIGILGIV